MVTMKDIARLANTSTGTVDRALNNKPGISEKTRANILGIAKSLNYIPNKLGKGLVLKRQNIKLGVILEPTKNPYFEKLKQGVEQATAELKDYGITTYVFTMNSYDENEQIHLLQRLRDLEVSGVALNAINSEKVRRAIDDLVDAHIKVVTCNTDNNKSKRSCFFGFENEQSGRVAAELLAKFTGESGLFLVEIGFEYILAHKDRQKGFLDKIREDYPNVSIAGIIESEEEDAVAFEKTLTTLNQHPEINGIFVAGYGIQGVVNAVKIKNLQGKIKILCYDYTEQTAQYLYEGVIDALLCQDPIKHGYTPLKILSELVTEGKEPKHSIYLTNVDIRLRENLLGQTHEWDI